MTDPAHSLGSICNSISYIYLFIYMLHCFFEMVRNSVSLVRRYLTIAHVLFKNTEPKVENYYSSYFYPEASIASAY